MHFSFAILFLPSVLSFVPLTRPLPVLARTPHQNTASTSSGRPDGAIISFNAPTRTSVVRKGLFGLGAPEIAVILAVAAFVIGPSKLSEMARSAGSSVGDMQDVPKGFLEGYESAETSEETKQLARSFGKTTTELKETAADLAGDYAEVASEFTAGVQSSAKEYNKELVGGLQGANALVGDARSGVKDLKKTLAPAKESTLPSPPKSESP